MSILDMSKWAALLILAIVVIRAVAINRLPKNTFLVLWGLALLRLLVPYAMPSPVSIQALFAWLAKVMAQPIETPPVMLTPVQMPMTMVPQQVAPPPETANAAVQGAASGIDGWLVLWLVGCVALIAYFAVTYVRCRKHFQASLPLSHPVVEAWLSGNTMRRPFQVRVIDCLGSPLTYGIFRPVILMPKASLRLSEEKIRYILTHEATHIRRFDAVTKLLLTAALCIHWFNPLVWVMYILANRDIELACDETVVRVYGDRLKSSYAMTLITMEEKRSRTTPLISNFSKYAIEERINAIMNTKKFTFLGGMLAVILILTMAMVFATSAVATNSNPEAAPVVATISEANGTATLSTFQATDLEWYTYEEYKAWMEKERETMDSLVKEGATGWTQSTGVFTWDEQKANEIIAQYEDILAQIENGLLVSKPTEDGNVTIMMNTVAAVSGNAVVSETEQGSLEVSIARDMGATSSAPLVPSEEAISITMVQDVAESGIAPAGSYSFVAGSAAAQTMPATATIQRSVETMPATIAVQRDTEIMPTTATFHTTAQAVPATPAMPLEEISYSFVQPVEGSMYITERAAAPAQSVSASRQFSATIDAGNKVTSTIGPFASQAELDNAVQSYCQAQVMSGLMTQSDMAKIMQDIR